MYCVVLEGKILFRAASRQRCARFATSKALWRKGAVVERVSHQF